MIFESTRAACRGQTAVFFPAKESQPHEDPNTDERKALAICERCPVQAQCRRSALANPKLHEDGVIGGMTAGQRRALLRKARAA